MAIEIFVFWVLQEIFMMNKIGMSLVLNNPANILWVNSNIHTNRSDNYSYPRHGQNITILTEVKSPTKMMINPLKRMLLEDVINMVNNRQRDRYMEMIIIILLTDCNHVGFLARKI